MTTSDLIEALAADSGPVRRLSPPLLRAAIWLAAFLALAGIVTWGGGAWPAMCHRLGNPRFAVEMTATVLTGIAAIIAVFHAILPDRRSQWRLLPLPFLFLWLASAGYGCYRNWHLYGADNSLRLRGSLHCFGIIVGIGVVLAAALYMVLRKTRPLDPVLVMMIAGLGAASLAAAMLQFYHVNDVSVMDLALHLAAVATVVALMIALGCRRMGQPARARR